MLKEKDKADMPVQEVNTLKSKVKSFMILQGIIVVVAFGDLSAKLLAQSDFLSIEFFFYYIMLCIASLIFAVSWQQILKVLPLNVAYANKSVVIIWELIFGRIFFNEIITPYMILGSIIIIIGLILVVNADV